MVDGTAHAVCSGRTPNCTYRSNQTGVAVPCAPEALSPGVLAVDSPTANAPPETGRGRTALYDFRSVPGILTGDLESAVVRL